MSEHGSIMSRLARDILDTFGEHAIWPDETLCSSMCPHSDMCARSAIHYPAGRHWVHDFRAYHRSDDRCRYFKEIKKEVDNA